MISNDLNENSIMFLFLDRFLKLKNDLKMKFSIEIGIYDYLKTHEL
jgi:hypothetical protein